MTRQEFNSYLDDLTSETGFDLSKEQKAFAYQAAKEYHNQALRIHDVVGRNEQLNCDHEWKVEAFDCYGMPYEQYCEHCGKKEAI